MLTNAQKAEVRRRMLLTVDPDPSLLPGFEYLTGAQTRFNELPPELQRQVRLEHEHPERPRAEKLRAEEERLRSLLTGGAPEHGVYAEHLRILHEAHDAVLLLDPHLGRGGTANLRARKTRIRTVSNVADYATGLHELGHIINGPCDPREHHQDPGEVACVACEVAAWRTGMQLGLVWTRPMHDHLRYCLGTYVSSTAATNAARRAAEHPANQYGIS